MNKPFWLLLGALVLLAGCASTPPNKADNLCEVFDQKRGWYKDARRAERRWGSDIATLMAMTYQESSFKPKAKPPRTKILWVIPGPRKSSAYGYAQVKDETWQEYQRLSGNHWASRSRFEDAIDFIGWYNAQSHERLGLGLNQARELYLAYHEGRGGYERRTFESKGWLKKVASKVGSRAERYREQVRGCERRFKGPWWWPLR